MTSKLRLSRVQPFTAATLLFGAFAILSSCSQDPNRHNPARPSSKTLKPLKQPTVESRDERPSPTSDRFINTGMIYHGKASWYNVRTNGGTHTASGERLRDHSATAAHRTLPFGTHVRVTNRKNGRSVIVRINDRGPFRQGRIIDVTIGMARQLGMVQAGVVPCKVEVLQRRH